MKKTDKACPDEIWNQLSRKFNNWQKLKPKCYWLKTGLSLRTKYNRVQQLENSKQANFFQACTKSLNNKQFNMLFSKAIVNVEQAQSAARIATLTNITITIGVIVLINQIFPGSIGGLINEMNAVNNQSTKNIILISMIIFSLLLSVFNTVYSHAGAASAQDLKHLFMLESTKRKSTSSIDESKEETSDLVSDLRENFISDV